MPATHRKGEGGYLQSLNERARAKPIDNFASIRTYYRSADLLLRQADQYRRSGNDEELYVMLMRFVSLVVEGLPKHVSYDAGDPKYRQLMKAVEESYFPELERVSASLKLRHLVDRLERQGAFQPRKSAGTVLLSSGNLPEIHWEASLAPPLPPPPAAGAQLGVPQPAGFDLLSSMGMAPPPAASSSSSVMQQQQQQPGTAWQSLGAPSIPALPLVPELNIGLRLPAASQATLSKHALLPMGSFGSTHQQHQQQQQRPERQQPPALQRQLYPELAALTLLQPLPAAQQQADGLQPPLAQQQQEKQQQQQPPYPQPSPYNEMQLGPQEVGVVTAARPTQPLPPDASCCQSGQQQLVPAPPQPVPLPTNGGVSEVKRLQTIRDVHVSVALMDEFMRYAVSNTRRGIESCGILAGTLSADDAVFTITTLIVPKQQGTTDTVEMLNEEEIFEVQDSRALYPLGWIHTHPTQTCFLSSVDIHTHCGFQTMLDESVAIVMAPTDPTKRVGIFRLTTPGGMKLVQRCPQRGFHAHPPTETGQPVYELCGHVYLNPRAKYEVVDLR